MMERTAAVTLRFAVPDRYRTRVYRATTAAAVLACVVGGGMELLRLDPFYATMVDLGYPSYLATIMGTAKLIAAVVLAVPKLPRLKEWAYAGVMINMIGAFASHVATHEPFALFGPVIFAALALVSWASRPAARRL